MSLELKLNRVAGIFVASALLPIAVVSLSAADAPPAKSSNTAANVSNKAVPKHTNRLAKEKSPYLLQHAHNPVDWYPWGEEAFAKARAEKKPIFLSIGYSTCHWCHVMERESFEDEKVAKYMNDNFVCIKVDREERPDVDQIYMTAVQAMTGQGGWPLNVFITPDLKPFYGGTYFPPSPAFGRPSFMQLLEKIHETWQSRSDDIKTAAAQLHDQLNGLVTNEPVPGSSLSGSVLTNALNQFKDEYDPRYGGFGNAPKFPRPVQPSFMLNAGKRFGDAEAVKMVLFTCDHMAAGGMYDQLGGGFARYSVDAQWLVPHFEKMLYDNAQLVNLYLDAYLVSGEQKHADTVRDIIRYVLRDMTHAQGGFYSAEDADSEGKEGKFYCWTQEEMGKLLSPEELKVAVRYFGVTEEGNFVDHSDANPLPHQNVLSIVDPKLSAEETKLLASAKKKMFEARTKRIRPHLDDKVLSSWNGLMLSALARAYAILGDESYRAAAEKNIQFIESKLWDAKTKT
ncbi:MAG TPA: thioredoxin domain-containing protein, partial [Alphaproteobacteria bacterium]|nr:thioredoxin domain-containing protein [Alphaproteobacteria bacterium]